MISISALPLTSQSSLSGPIVLSPLASRPWQCIDLEPKHAFLRNVALIRNGGIYDFHQKSSVWEAKSKPCLLLLFLLPLPSLALLCARRARQHISARSQEDANVLACGHGHSQIFTSVA